MYGNSYYNSNGGRSGHKYTFKANKEKPVDLTKKEKTSISVPVKKLFYEKSVNCLFYDKFYYENRKYLINTEFKILWN